MTNLANIVLIVPSHEHNRGETVRFESQLPLITAGYRGGYANKTTSFDVDEGGWVAGRGHQLFFGFAV